MITRPDSGEDGKGEFVILDGEERGRIAEGKGKMHSRVRISGNAGQG
jgi:hypothetical protein